MGRTPWLAMLSATALFACDGPAGDLGPSGAEGPDGARAAELDGAPGADGVDGQNGGDGAWLDAYPTQAGLDVELLDATIDGEVARVAFRLTDATGTPLDREGLKTEGAVSLRFVLGWLDELAPGEPLQYRGLTTRVQTSPISGESAVQPTADDGGTFEEIDRFEGIYAYELATSVPATEPDKTYTVGVYATRDFEGARYVDNEVLHFRPDQQPVVTTREVVETTASFACSVTPPAWSTPTRATAWT